MAERDERAELWRRMSEVFDGFDHYRDRTTREIRVFVLEPR